MRRIIALLGLLVLLATQAAAAGPLTFTDGSSHFGATHTGSGHVVDDWKFSVAAPSIGNASLVSAALGPVGTHWFEIIDATLLGDGIAVAFEPVRLPQNGRWQSWFLPDSHLPPGDYTLRIEGNTYRAMGAGSYAGTVNVSPIPEPHTTALLAAGLAAVAWVAHRKRKASYG